MPDSVGKALEFALKEKSEPRSQSKKSASKIFSNKNRRDIYTVLTMFPCIGAAAIAHLTEISINTVTWHLGKLRAAGYVIERGAGARCMYLPEGLVPTEDVDLFSLLNRQKGSQILSLVIKNPGSSQGELADGLDIAHQSVSKVMKGLETQGVVSIVSEGNHIRYFPTRFLTDKAENFYQKSKRFSEYLFRKLKEDEKEEPKVVKKGVDRIILELGSKSARYTLEVGINPYITML